MDVKALEKTRMHKVNQPRWYVIKARIKEEVDRTCQLVVSEYQTLQDWRPRRRRDFSFLNGDSKNNCALSSIDRWEPPEERLNGWVQGWDRGLHCGLGVGVRTSLCSRSSIWARGAGFRLGCSFFLGKETEGGRTRTTGHVQRPGVGTEWCPPMHTHTHTHNHYLKGFANLPDSQPVWQPVMQFQTFVMTG